MARRLTADELKKKYGGSFGSFRKDTALLEDENGNPVGVDGSANRGKAMRSLSQEEVMAKKEFADVAPDPSAPKTTVEQVYSNAADKAASDYLARKSLYDSKAGEREASRQAFWNDKRPGSGMGEKITDDKGNLRSAASFEKSLERREETDRLARQAMQVEKDRNLALRKTAQALKQRGGDPQTIAATTKDLQASHLGLGGTSDVDKRLQYFRNEVDQQRGGRTNPFETPAAPKKAPGPVRPQTKFGSLDLAPADDPLDDYFGGVMDRFFGRRKVSLF